MNEPEIGFSLNDAESNKLAEKKDNLSKKAKIFIIISIIILCLLIITLIIIFSLKNSDDNNNKETKGEFTCVYDIKTISQETNTMKKIQILTFLSME